jgi:hypothetical protein
MKFSSSCVSLMTSAAVLAATLLLLLTSRLEYCGQPATLRPAVRVADTSGSPTLAPPQKVVVVRIETDKPDIEVRWSN